MEQISDFWFQRGYELWFAGRVNHVVLCSFFDHLILMQICLFWRYIKAFCISSRHCVWMRHRGTWQKSSISQLFIFFKLAHFMFLSYGNNQVSCISCYMNVPRIQPDSMVYLQTSAAVGLAAQHRFVMTDSPASLAHVGDCKYQRCSFRFRTYLKYYILYNAWSGESSCTD